MTDKIPQPLANKRAEVESYKARVTAEKNADKKNALQKVLKSLTAELDELEKEFAPTKTTGEAEDVKGATA